MHLSRQIQLPRWALDEEHRLSLPGPALGSPVPLSYASATDPDSAHLPFPTTNHAWCKKTISRSSFTEPATVQAREMSWFPVGTDPCHQLCPLPPHPLRSVRRLEHCREHTPVILQLRGHQQRSPAMEFFVKYVKINDKNTSWVKPLFHRISVSSNPV